MYFFCFSKPVFISFSSPFLGYLDGSLFTALLSTFSAFMLYFFIPRFNSFVVALLFSVAYIFPSDCDKEFSLLLPPDPGPSRSLGNSRMVTKLYKILNHGKCQIFRYFTKTDLNKYFSIVFLVFDTLRKR